MISLLRDAVHAASVGDSLSQLDAFKDVDDLLSGKNLDLRIMRSPHSVSLRENLIIAAPLLGRMSQGSADRIVIARFA
jgi:hypothetical protein